MKFTLVDRIVRFPSRSKICAIKGLSLSEEYLADHFPGNPVMPGVLMLEAMIQTGAWLLRASKDFSFSVYVPQEVSNVKYAKFLIPGDQLAIEVELLGAEGAIARFAGLGKMQDKTVVSARWTVRFYNLASEDARLAHNDRVIVETAKQEFKILGGEECWKQMAVNVS